MASSAETVTPAASKSTARSAAGAALPPIQSVASCLDSKEVEKLDSWFEGVSQPSRRIRELVQRKRRKHESLLRQLRQRLFRERSEAENTVALIATGLKTELEKASLMVKLKREELATLQVSAGGYKEAVSAAWEVVRGLSEQRHRAVDAFYDLLLDVEAEHQQRVKGALREHGRLLARNGHLPPPQLQLLLDAETKEVSEKHLRHIIGFGDLRLCLNLDAERDCRKFKEAVERAKRVAREQCQRDTLSALQAACNKSVDECIDSTAMGRESLLRFERVLSELKDALSWPTTYPLPSGSVQAWEAQLRSHLKQLDEAALQIINGLTEGLKQMKAFGSQEIERLSQLLTDNDLCSQEKFQLIYDNVCQPLLTSMGKKICDQPSSLLEHWKYMQTQLNCKIEALVLLLGDAGELWAQYNQKQESGRHKILETLESKVQNRTKCVEAKEQRLALIVEKSRQETNKQCLQENIDRIHRILDEINISYMNEQKMEEQCLHENFSKLIAHLLNDLNVSTRKFFENHQLLILQEDEDDSKLSAKFIDKTGKAKAFIKLQEERWYNEIELFFTQKIENFVRQDGEEWMTKELTRLQGEFDHIFKSHKLRYNQIQSEIQFVRLAEIEEHQNLIEKRREITLEILKNAKSELQVAFSQEFQLFKDLSSHIQTLRENGLNDSSESSVKQIIHEVGISYTVCKDSVMGLINEYQTMMLVQSQRVKNKNLDLLESMRQFSDGGTFTACEVTNIKSIITGLELDIEAQGKRNVSSLKQKSKECCAEAIAHVKMCLSELQVHLENVTFTKNVSFHVKNLQGQLRKSVLTLKYGGRLLRKQTSEFDETNLHMETTLDLMDKWRCVMETMQKRKGLLLHQKEKEDLNGEIVKPYMEELLQYKQKNNAFLSQNFQQLKESLQQIEMTALEFHQQRAHGNIMNSSTSLQEVNNFMSALSSKYRLYQEQCIKVWLTELTDYCELILSLRNHHSTLCDKILSTLLESLSISILNEKKLLKDELMTLRTNYQKYQVQTMARLSPEQGYLRDQHDLNIICAKFGETSELLSRKVEDMIDSYMLKAHEFLDKYEEELRKQKAVIMKTIEQLFGNELVDTIQKCVEHEIEHLSRFYSFPLLLNLHIYSLSNKSDGKDIDKDKIDVCERVTPKFNKNSKKKLPPYVEQALMKVVIAIRKFLEKQENLINKYSTPTLLTKTFQNKLQEASALVHSETYEVTHLYVQYKEMAEELRFKWRSTLESVQQLNAPSSSC